MVSIADGVERRLDPRSIVVQRIAGGITVSIIAFVLLIGVVIVVFAGSPGRVLGLLLVLGFVLVCGLLGTLALAWPVLHHRHSSYAVTEQAIVIRRGVLWRSIQTVPRSRVQHTDVSQGPVERLYELATLVIYTAGTEHASVPLSGLARETALAIRDHLIGGGEGEDDAV
jgi:membrane protein YdbS with pleckstrin-like domain